MLETTDLSRKNPPDRARRGLGRTFQTPRVFPGLTVAENLIVAQRQRKRGGDTLRSIPEVLDLVGISRAGRRRE